jgi:hypothetical protein
MLRRPEILLGRKAVSITSRRLKLATAGLMSVALLAAPTIPASAAVTVPISLQYAGTFVVTPGDPSPCVELGLLPLTDTLTGIGSHLGRFTATYPHCVNIAANTFSGTATFEAPNGDQLFVLLEGSADDPTCATTCGVIFTGTIMGGTGRFERAQGTLSGTGSVDLTASTVTAELWGTINKDPMPF